MASFSSLAMGPDVPGVPDAPGLPLCKSAETAVPGQCQPPEPRLVESAVTAQTGAVVTESREWHVCQPGGLLHPTCDTDNPQQAVDWASPGDIIKLEAGTFTGAEPKTYPYDTGFWVYTKTTTQTVIISQSLTFLGGYTPTNWEMPQGKTTLDAQGEGRVFLIDNLDHNAPPINVTLENLIVTNGWSEATNGGGIFADRTNLTVRGCRVRNNHAGAGGGGIGFYGGHFQLEQAWVTNNTADTYTGGVVIWGFSLNATGRVENSVIANNNYGGIFTLHAQWSLIHSTIANNGVGLEMGNYQEPETIITGTNNIFAGNGVGIETSSLAGFGCSQANFDHTLWGSGNAANGTDWEGDEYGCTVTTQNDLYGNPAFLVAYHIGPGSAARDQGAATEVSVDIDGEPRADGLPDIGADEYASLPTLYLPLVFINN
ncbi:hypothetical protein KKB83_05505 [Patescibacteria group bacterium]|nr:hypothetical protein [Patescibacteria group bacterium]